MTEISAMKIDQTTVMAVAGVLCMLGGPVPLAPANAAVLGADGGITLWVSFDNLDATGARLDDLITEADVLPGGFSCGATNNARAALGVANSPPSCAGGTGSCTAREKVRGDLDWLADYISEATEGAHYLRRVYVSDQGRAWNSADINWNIGNGGSSAPTSGWANPDAPMSLNSAYRTCIHDVIHHELGHYFYRLPDRYARSGDYYYGRINGGPRFQVNVTTGDPNTVMSGNFPHRFVDTTNARIVVDYDQPGPGTTVGEVLTPPLLTDADPDNDGPDRDHHGFTNPFAQDEWSLLPLAHVDLAGVHTEGVFPAPGPRPAVDVVFIGDDEPHPGSILLLDRSGSMAVQTDGIPAAQFVQEAGMFLYHSSAPTDLVGTSLYNQNLEILFPYAPYDAANDLPFVSFRNAAGLTDIAAALEAAIDALLDTHGEGGASGAEVYLMSDGRQTTGENLWDQVTRANTRGIRIHTFSFGDADATVMEAIAAGSSGNAIPVSELDDAAELKMIMTRALAVGRGKTPVYSFKGRLEPRYTFGNSQLAGGTFEVPAKSSGLQVYAFLRAEDAAELLSIALVDPAGETVWSMPDNVAHNGRFNAVQVDAPLPGTWTWWIRSNQGGLTQAPIELVAYAHNRELRSRVWFDGFRADGRLPVHAQLFFRYPLSGLEVDVSLYLNGRLLTVVPMQDDGANGVDDQPGDGIYSTVIDLSAERTQALLRQQGFAGIKPSQVRKLRAEVRFAVGDGAGPAPHALYEVGATTAQLQADYDQGNRSTFSAWATGVINLADRDRPDDQRQPGLLLPELKAPVRVRPGDTGELRIRLTNLLPLIDQLRVSLGAGVETTVTDDTDAGPEDQGTGRALLVRYRVGDDASVGQRELALQFQDRIVRRAGVLEVTRDAVDGDDPQPGTSGAGKRLLLVLVLLLLGLYWLRRRHA